MFEGSLDLGHGIIAMLCIILEPCGWTTGFTGFNEKHTSDCIVFLRFQYFILPLMLQTCDPANGNAEQIVNSNDTELERMRKKQLRVEESQKKRRNFMNSQRKTRF